MTVAEQPTVAAPVVAAPVVAAPVVAEPVVEVPVVVARARHAHRPSRAAMEPA